MTIFQLLKNVLSFYYNHLYLVTKLVVLQKDFPMLQFHYDMPLSHLQSLHEFLNFSEQQVRALQAEGVLGPKD